ncbi:MAG: helix-turn-helix domain-containing protein [Lachnospiraceae bacterium]|nr:helix-turn-helix domain-containing protein [Lachnospiraceae bacterium]
MFTDERLYKSVSKNIRKYRILNKLTQAQFAEMLSLDTQYYAQLERGERYFSLDKIALVCSIFSLKIDDIIELDPEDLDEAQEEKRTDLIIDITDNLDKLSFKQLLILSRYLDEVLPYSEK